MKRTLPLGAVGYALIAYAILAAGTGRAAQGDWKQFTKDDGLPGNEIQFLKERADGAVWVGTLTGLGTIKDGKCSVVIGKPSVWDVLPADGGGYWVGTSDGVLLVDRNPGATALKGYSIAPLIQMAGGKIWALAKKSGGQESFVAQFDGKDWKKVLEGEAYKDMFRTADGHIWISEEGNGVIEIPSWETPAEKVRHLEGREVTAFKEDPSGDIWCGTWGQGLYHLHQGQWERELAQEKSAILDIDFDSKGRVWVATNAHGLWRREGTSWTNDLADERGVNLMEPTSDGRIWVSNQARGGLRCWNGRTWTDALPGPYPIRCILETRNGDIWAGGVLDGVHVLRK